MASAMTDLAAFVLARLAEDEAAARAASPGPWHVNAESDEVLAVDDITVADGFALSGPQLRATTAHIAHHDPAWVLADVAAKRAIVELHPEVLGICQGCANEMYPCRTVVALAQPYADHPDFDPAWKVEP